jgi:glucose-6-phosphate 1-dehydrogenase
VADSNPFASQKNIDDCTMVIFGASGDLTKRKLMPALYNLAIARELPQRFSIVGYARTDMNDEVFRQRMREAVSQYSRTGLKDESLWERFAQNLYYVRGGYEEADAFQRIAETLSRIEKASATRRNRVLYLATPPDVYVPIIRNLAAAGLNANSELNGGRARIVIEKPFGTNLKTARELNVEVHRAAKIRCVIF